MTEQHLQRFLGFVPTVALSLVLLIPLPASAQVTEICEGGLCTATFVTSGELHAFNFPEGAQSITFEVHGAQGGRTGGMGGKVVGALHENPAIIYVAVGSSGGFGSGVEGGFNGGGSSGLGGAASGAGGGSSDIRLGLESSSRIVVAGGGGGRGSGLGSGGGAGGGLSGLPGRTGQGAGGGGGTPLQGGFGGQQNGDGSAGHHGSFDQGGSGGSSYRHGGGGGGGGHFGGGGGGSDTDLCCSDAGGGGGGSSFTDSLWVSDPEHSQGVKTGNGLVILRYQVPPSVTSFVSEAPHSLDGNMTFQLTFESEVHGLESSDLDITHSSGTCVHQELLQVENTYFISLSDCDDGKVSLILKSLSVSNSHLSGPVFPVPSSPVVVDTSPPTAEWQNVRASEAQLIFSESVQVTQVQMIELETEDSNCLIEEVIQQLPELWSVYFVGCDQASFTVSLMPLSVADSLGHTGPLEVISASFEPQISPEPPLEEPDLGTDEGTEPDAPPASGAPQDDENLTGPDSGIPDREVVAPSPAPSAPAIGSPEVSQEPSVILQPGEGESPTGERKIHRSDSFQSNTKESMSKSKNPASSSVPKDVLEQAALVVTIPNQKPSFSVDQRMVLFGFLALGIFGVLAGLFVSRKGVTETLVS